jgi:hypothetical protein
MLTTAHRCRTLRIKEATNMTKYNDSPLVDLAESAAKVIADGGTIFFKWTCAGCGDRVTATEPNTFTPFSEHDDCGHITNTLKTGGNYLAITGVSAGDLIDILGKVGGAARKLD